MTLAQAASDLLLVLLEIQKPGVEIPSAATLRERLTAALAEIDDDDARYALVAALDEGIQFTGKAHQLGWDIQPLQSALFGERNAGVRFFERLDKVRRRGPEARPVLEVFHLCLCLGFQGRYRMGPPDELARLMAELAAELGHHAEALCPQALPKSPPPPPPRTFPWIPAAAGVLVLALALSGALYLLLDSARGDALAAMRVFGG